MNACIIWDELHALRREQGIRIAVLEAEMVKLRERVNALEALAGVEQTS